MALATNINGLFYPTFILSNTPLKEHLITAHSSFISLPTPKLKIPIYSSRICTRGGKPRIVACSNGRDLEEESLKSKEASFDLKLPRRSLSVQFTCNACGERTRRMVNRVAYERGTVFVQCAGCLVHHKLVDNLGLVVEYDLREEIEEDVGTK